MEILRCVKCVCVWFYVLCEVCVCMFVCPEPSLTMSHCCCEIHFLCYMSKCVCVYRNSALCEMCVCMVFLCCVKCVYVCLSVLNHL